MRENPEYANNDDIFGQVMWVWEGRWWYIYTNV